MYSIKIQIPLYDIKIKLFFSYDLYKPIKKIKKKHNKKNLYKINDIDFDGIVIGEFIPKEKLIYVLIKRTKKGIDVDTVTHEVYHLTTKIMNYNGFEWSTEEEAFAKLNGKLNSIIIGELIKQGHRLHYLIDNQIKIKK